MTNLLTPTILLVNNVQLRTNNLTIYVWNEPEVDTYCYHPHSIILSYLLVPFDHI